MSISLFLEQVLNGLQFGVMLFLMSAGLTLVFGVMGLINLAHGSLYMIGAFAAAAIASWTGSFWLGLVASLMAAAIAGVIVEIVIIRRLYKRDHLDQVLATFALILLFSEAMRWIFGAFPLFLDVPEILSGTLSLPLGIEYSKYRMMIIVVGILIAVGLFSLISKTRLGVRIRAGESDREMIAALGVDISKLYTLVFALGAALAGLAGAMVGAIQSVEVGMGEPVLILALVIFASWRPGKALLGAILFGAFDAFQVRLQTEVGAFLPSQVFLMAPYVLSLIALVIVARKAEYPRALLKPWFKGAR
ncbi:branched-chain amino acid ABC transporter permease [Amylibacter sp.]|nr:branched-chain amino acid ABC transporter permease [Amylibacter sp.]